MKFRRDFKKEVYGYVEVPFEKIRHCADCGVEVELDIMGNCPNCGEWYRVI